MMNTPVIQVGILTGSTLSFELQGRFYSPDHNIFKPGIYKACLSAAGIELESAGSRSSPYEMLMLQPDPLQSSSFKLLGVTIGIGFHWQKQEDQLFSGGLRLVVSGDSILAINVLPVEDYLVSVISSEMNATSSLEMLKAHAVISRSWLLAQMEKEKSLREAGSGYQSVQQEANERIVWYDREDHIEFDVCADDHCQRYQGITRASTPQAAAAVNQTAGEVLQYAGRLCDTRFSKCCGGVTELFENTWEPVHHPYLQRIYDHAAELPEAVADLTGEEAARNWIMTQPEAYCNTSDKSVLEQVLNDYDQTTRDFYRWTVRYTAEELGELIRSRMDFDFGTIRDLIPIQRGVSGRIIRLKIIGSAKTMIIGKELEIRKALSKTHLYSSAFVVDRIQEGGTTSFMLHGAGWGHGVGLCQIGAAVMGAKGYTYREILLHYFRGAELVKRY
jgi:SpoIID/LytB domain protein